MCNNIYSFALSFYSFSSKKMGNHFSTSLDLSSEWLQSREELPSAASVSSWHMESSGTNTGPEGQSVGLCPGMSAFPNLSWSCLPSWLILPYKENCLWVVCMCQPCGGGPDIRRIVPVSGMCAQPCGCGPDTTDHLLFTRTYLTRHRDWSINKCLFTFFSLRCLQFTV